MDFNERVLAWVATELLDLQEAAEAAGELFIAYLIQMARIEAERRCVENWCNSSRDKSGRFGDGSD